jgi:hypothetical protein
MLWSAQTRQARGTPSKNNSTRGITDDADDAELYLSNLRNLWILPWIRLTVF